MATDSTNLPNELNTDAGSDMAGNELEFGAVQVAQVTADGGQPVNLPQGQRVVLIPVQPGQTLTLPTDTQSGLLAKIGPEGNLSIVVDGRTIIFQGYVNANSQTPVRIVTTDGEEIDVADVVAATDPTLNIQTAAGPATGDQGDEAGNGIFVPFQVGAGPGLIDAEGVLGATALQYRLIDDEREEFVQDEDTAPTDIEITFDLLGGIINEDDLRAPAIIERDQLAAKLVIQPNGNDEEGNDPFDTKDRENQNGTPDDTDDVDDVGGVDPDREPLVTVATVKVTFGDDIPGTLTVDPSELPEKLTSEGEPIIYGVLSPDPADPDLIFGNGIVAFVDGLGGTAGKYDEGIDRKVFDIRVKEASSDGEFHVLFTLYDNLDNTPPDANGDKAADLLGADDQILDLPVKLTAKDSDGSSLSAIMKLGVEDDIPFFGHAVEIEGEGGFSVTITPGDSSITHDESWFVQSDNGADDQSLFDPQASSAAFDATQEVIAAGFGLPYGDSVGSLIGIAQTQVLASFGADGASQEFAPANDPNTPNDPSDAKFRNSIFGELEDRTNADKDGANDGENEHPFELFMIEAGKGSTPLEDDLDTAENEGNLTIEKQLTNATVTWDGDQILNVYLRQIDATTIVGYVIPEGEQPAQEALGLKNFDGENGEEAVFVISIDPLTGVMTFVQYHQINNPNPGDGSGGTHDEDLRILGADGVTQLVHVRITDYDGDHATQPVVVAIQDDGPCFIKTYWEFDGDSTNPFNGIGIIDEDALPNGKSGGPGDDSGGKHADGTVFFDFGVDQPGTIDIQGLKITNSLGQPVAEIDADGNFVSGALRTADGRDIEVTRSVDADTGIITWQGVVAVDEDGAGTPVFTLTLDGEGGNLGDFDFDLHLPLEHPFHDPDSKNNGPETSYEDNLNFEFTVRGEDVDGDWADGSIKIRIDDDSPVAVNDKDSVVEGKGNTATGNVVTAADLALIGTDANATDGSKDAPGADQPYTISKLVHGADTYNLIDNGGGAFSVTKNGGNPLGAGESFVGGKLTIPTDAGGTFEIVLVSATQAEVGEYRYTGGEPPAHAVDAFGGPVDAAASNSAAFDTLGEWTTSFTTAGITLTPINGALAIKDINVSGPNDYRGIGVSSGGGEVEVDNVGPDEQLKVGLPGLTNNATLQIGALFDGNQFDSGNQEILQWQVFNGAVLIASGQILGSDNGLVSLDIDTGGQQFNNIILTPINNGAGDNGNNSDFLLLNVEICSQKDVNETFDYTLRDADGDELTATLAIKVEDTQPTIPTQNSGGIEIIVDEDGLNPSGTIKDGIGDVQPGDADEGDAGPDDGKVSGTIPFIAGVDPVTIELTVGNNGDTGLETVDGKNIFAAWDAEEHRLVGYIEGTDPSDAANQVFIMQINDEQAGTFTFTLLQPIEHPDFDGQENGDNENIPDPYFLVNVQIEDKDCDVAYTTVKVTIDDDMPVVSISADSAGTTQHDETAGRQTDSGDDDQNGNPPAIFNALGAGTAIGWAHDGDSVVQINTARYGADGPGNSAYSLGIPAGNVDSGVDTTDGKSVWLFQGPNGIIVGRAGSGAGGATPDATGQIIFAISVDSDGELTVVQYDSLKHPDNPNNYDEDIGLNTEALQVKLTLTDADEDLATGSANIGNLVRFDDDGPKARIEATGHSVQHDETAGVQNPGSGADRDQAGALPAAFSGIVGTLIGWARSDFSAVNTAGSSTGSDDEGATTTLKVQVAFSGVDSGIDDTATGQSIFLYQNGDVVEGRVGNAAGAVAFAVTINGNGTLDVAQYRALEHPNTSDHDEDVSINNSALKVVYTIIDGDGDKATDEVDIGNAVHFDDDGPTANLTEVSGAQIVLDELVGVATGFADPNANDEAGNVANDIGYAKVSGASLFTDTSVFGQDGPAAANSKVFGLGISATGTNTGLDDVATGQDIRLYQVDGDTVEGRVGSSGGAVAFRIDINTSTGEVTISQFLAVQHDNAGSSAADHDEFASPEIMDTNKLFLNLTVTDGDLDKSTDNIDLGKLIKFEDDGPVANADVDSTKEDTGVAAIGNVYTGANATAFGSDVNATDGVADDIGSDGAASPTVKWVEGGGFDGNGQIQGLYGTLFVNSAGDYKYVVDDSKAVFNDLDEGETLLETFSYVITDKDGDTATSTLKITIDGDGDTPPPTATNATAKVDEDGIPTIGNNNSSSGDDNADLPPDTAAGEAVWRQNLPVNWNGFPGSITLAAGDWSALRTADNHALVVVNNGTSLLKAYDITDTTGGVPNLGAIPVFEVEIINATTGAYEVRLLQPLLHPDSNNNPADNAIDDGTGGYEDNLSIPVNVTYSNSGGNIVRTLTIDVDDDMPVVGLATSATLTLAVDETLGGGADVAPNPGTTAENDETLFLMPAALSVIGSTIGEAQASASGLFTSSVGADGQRSAVYDLAVTGGGVTGLVDTATGLAITLVKIGAVVEGRVGATTTVAFAFTVDVSTGLVSMAQYRAINHGNEEVAPGDHDEVKFMNSGVLAVTYTVTDNDGDFAFASKDISGAISFDDDGPTVTTTSNTIALGVDETLGGGADVVGGGPAAENDEVAGAAAVTAAGLSTVDLIGAATANASVLFTASAGQDGQQSAVYALSITNVATGLIDTATDSAITLVNNAGVIEGRSASGNHLVFAIAINPVTGQVTIADYRAINHGNEEAAPGQHDELKALAANSLSVTLTVTDKDGDSTSTSKDISGAVTFDDDGPVANPLTKSTSGAGVNTNLLITLDISGSMGNPSGLTDLNKLELAIASIKELIEQYDALGDVMVRLVTFSTNADEQGAVWMTVDQVKTVLDSLTDGGTTNYDEALTDAVAAFGDSGKLVNAQNVAYFLSDGNPNQPVGDEGIDSGEETTWINFLKANDVNSFALGFGEPGDVDQSNLDPIAYNGKSETNTEGVVITDLNLLTAALVSTVAGPVSGNLKTDGGNKNGTDGSGIVSQFTFNGTQFNFNGTTITQTGTVIPFAQAAGMLTFSNANFEMVLNMFTGAYTYSALPGAVVPANDFFGYTLTDADGDSATSTLLVSTSGVDVAPIVRDDHIIAGHDDDGGTDSIVISSAALLWNDTDANDDPISITGAFTNVTGFNGTGVTLAGGNLEMQDNGNGGTFTYTATANAKSDTGNVVLDRDQEGQNSLDGDGLDNIIVSDGSANTLNGEEGNDVLLGNAGIDTLNGDAGRDWLVGGSDDDVLVGGAGNDLITLSSANGDNDVIRITSALDGNDVVQNFGDGVSNGGAGSQDTIDLNQLFDNLGVATGDRAGRVQVSDGGADALVTVDLTGDGFGAGDIQIRLVGIGVHTDVAVGSDIVVGSL